MSKSNYLEAAFLDLILNGEPIPNVADNAASAPLTNLYVALYTGDPGETGDATTNECAYGSYARVACPRLGSPQFWDISDGVATPISAITFPQASSGTETVTHMAIVSSSSGSGNIFWSGTVTPNISVSTGVTPELTTGTTVTET